MSTLRKLGATEEWSTERIHAALASFLDKNTNAHANAQSQSQSQSKFDLCLELDSNLDLDSNADCNANANANATATANGTVESPRLCSISSSTSIDKHVEYADEHSKSESQMQMQMPMPMPMQMSMQEKHVPIPVPVVHNVADLIALAEIAHAQCLATQAACEQANANVRKRKREVDSAHAEVAMAKDAHALAAQEEARARDRVHELDVRAQEHAAQLHDDMRTRAQSFVALDRAFKTLCETRAALQRARESSVRVSAGAGAKDAPTSTSEFTKVLVQEMLVPEVRDMEPLSKRRKRIPAYIRTCVWYTYIGKDVAVAPCVCCQISEIHIRSFHCGHVRAESKGGDLAITNLRPICANCNAAMGTRSMDEFAAEFFKRTL